MELNSSNFKEIISSDKPTLVDFWADWCGPCHMVSPVIDELADDYAGKITVGKVNVDAEQTIAAEYSIASIPTVILFKSGTAVKKFVGVRSADDYAEMIEDNL